MLRMRVLSRGSYAHRRYDLPRGTRSSVAVRPPLKPHSKTPSLTTACKSRGFFREAVFYDAHAAQDGTIICGRLALTEQAVRSGFPNASITLLAPNEGATPARRHSRPSRASRACTGRTSAGRRHRPTTPSPAFAGVRPAGRRVWLVAYRGTAAPVRRVSGPDQCRAAAKPGKPDCARHEA